MKDFRQEHKTKHKLTEMLFMVVMAIIINANTWIEIEVFVHIREKFSKKYMGLENAIPSHDTF
jgi:flagellin-specific chaperone FliS